MNPTLSELTIEAIEILSKNPKGFFLFVEGRRIDDGHHASMDRIALDETVEFSKAIGLAHDKMGDNDTLHVVTADQKCIQCHFLDMLNDKSLSHQFEFPCMVFRHNETHGKVDVAIYAIGPYAHLFRGSLEQNIIPHIMANVSCVGNGLVALKSSNKVSQRSIFSLFIFKFFFTNELKILCLALILIS